MTELHFDWPKGERSISAPDAVLVNWKNPVQRRRVVKLVIECLTGGGQVHGTTERSHDGACDAA